MKPKTLFICAACLAFFVSSCKQAGKEHSWTVEAPGKKIKVEVMLAGNNQPAYRILHGETVVVDTSFLGMEFRDQPPLSENLNVVKAKQSAFSETWETVWGDQQKILNAYSQLQVEFEETTAPHRRFSLDFRVFDDGAGFRYVFPKQEAMDSVVVMDEHTTFQLTGDHQTWWQPGDWEIYEHLYNESLFSGIDALSKRSKHDLAQSSIPENAVNTPVTMRTADGLHLTFHEAALYNYASMTLKVDKENRRWVSELVGSPDQSKAKLRTPFQTPWRTVQIAEKAGDLIESTLILNLNEPNKIEDPSWIQPMKYVGIWWEMHLGKSSWDMAGVNHGATTANAKRYIDFAAANNIGGILIEGWNTGWEDWWDDKKRETCFDFVTPYADFDLNEVLRHAKAKGVRLISHHETASGVTQYDKQLDTAFTQLEKLGIHSVKTGYVGTIIPRGEYHHGQFMVNHYQRVLELAARHKVTIDAHETIKDTGIRRTWPNFVARETFRGQEFNAWASDGGNPPNHIPTLAYTAMLAGPMDYTPGIFNIKFDEYKKENQVNTTLAHQLALYVAISSPIQMVADLPEHYAGNPAFQFIRDVAVNWEWTRALNGEVGDYVTLARKERGANRWFIGGVTDENGRTLEANLDFLPKGKTYQAVIYADGPNAHWNDNPTDVVIRTQDVDAATRLPLVLAPGGGVAIYITEKK
ncbi:MAG: glycoside hydrolase family 97 protein [Haliscomenobacter sp.]|nr:glycoside hydrolase family 97 protein [Haliscomenobacter sp.]MBK8652790.1 glycoside hydrolase family 97 protein [Haliscomenobacter sp.]MBP9076209.1 glycoside hydrolase family 97 protein [Haliscomenobacter sp.]MBP9872447.1 glycoside hydrolase family 97 protein [Haliscomenobacter sp.]